MPEVELSTFGWIRSGPFFIQIQVEKNLEEVIRVTFKKRHLRKMGKIFEEEFTEEEILIANTIHIRKDAHLQKT